MTKPIDQQALRIVDSMEYALATFHGLRHLWANQVANHRASMHSDLTIDPKTLAQEQKTQLWSAISTAMALHNYLWPEGAGTPHTHYRRGDIDDILTLRSALWLARQAMAAHDVPDAGARSAVDAALLATGGLEANDTPAAQAANYQEE